jgi:hypothetical protein
MVMDIENINLETISKQFEFEKRCREIENIQDPEELRSLLKSAIKLYLKQQETFAKIVP